MTKIKICGITHNSEIEYINKYLPDYAGFVFAKSKRRVTAEKAGILSAYLRQEIKKVGVFVDMEPASAAIVAAQVGLDVLQLHGSENDEYISTLRPLLKPGTEIWKAVRVSPLFMDRSFPAEDNSAGTPIPGSTVPNYAVTYSAAHDSRPATGLMPLAKTDRILLDSYLPGSLGGTGKTFDWTLASRFDSTLPIILAGGLNQYNVREAIKQVQPFAVDTSSGVEVEGIKDEYKLKAFIEAVRQN